MDKRPQAQAGIDQITLYTPGQAPKGAANLRKLSSNENLYGPSPKAIKAIKSAANDIWRYPDATHQELREAIAQIHELPGSQIICGNGSDEILALIANCYAGVGDEIITTQHGFEVYGIVAHAVGAELIEVPEFERVIDVDAILNALSEKTRVIFIANPANPTGTMLSAQDLMRLANGVPSHVVLVIDGAYAEFADDYDGGVHLVENHENIIMTRTFSKLYGLGGLRVGWAYAPQAMIDMLNRIRGPFNISALGLSGAKEAILDQDYAQSCRAKIVQDRQYLREALMQYGFAIDESHTNFLLVRFADADEATKAREFLAQKGYLVRAVAHYGLPDALRITIGTTEDNQAIANLLSEFRGMI